MVAKRSSRRKRGEEETEPEPLMSLSYKRPKKAVNQALVFLNNMTFADCDNQNTCPLFKVLSPEMRNRIYHFVFEPMIVKPTEADVVRVLQYNPAPRFGFPCNYTRIIPTSIFLHVLPDRGPPPAEESCSIDTALLRCCRVIYLEARFVPVKQDVHNFYFDRTKGRFYFDRPSLRPFKRTK